MSSKGKKFTAAEKHFEEKAVVLRREAKRAQEHAHALLKENGLLRQQVDSLQQQTLQQQEWIERLLEYTELDQKDIVAACNKDKSMGQLLSMMGIVDRAARGAY